MRTKSCVLLLLLTTAATAQIVGRTQRVLLTEATWGAPDAVEITNFDRNPADLTGWTVTWHDTFPRTSAPLAFILEPGESAIIAEPGSVLGDFPGAPAGTAFVAGLPAIPTSIQAFDVSLEDALGRTLDRVRVSSTAGAANAATSASGFFGLAMRSVGNSFGSVERIADLDTSSGGDWTEQQVASFGQQNSASGPRGTDSRLGTTVLINEVDFEDGYVELLNTGPLTTTLNGWYLAVSAEQGGAIVNHTLGLAPLQTMRVDDRVIVGSSALPPAELAGSAPYIQLTLPLGGTGLSSSECALALYDDSDRLVDLVRFMQLDQEVLHNHPRLAAPPAAFQGAAHRWSLAGGVMARFPDGADSDSGSNWRFEPVRSMGAVNATAFGPSGDGLAFDVRADGGIGGGGLSVIAALDGAPAGAHLEMIFSAGHADGSGPFFGLGDQALSNWQLLRAFPEFAPQFNADGVARILLPAGTLGAGFELDLRFVAFDAAGFAIAVTPILEFDS